MLEELKHLEDVITDIELRYQADNDPDKCGPWISTNFCYRDGKVPELPEEVNRYYVGANPFVNHLGMSMQYFEPYAERIENAGFRLNSAFIYTYPFGVGIVFKKTESGEYKPELRITGWVDSDCCRYAGSTREALRNYINPNIPKLQKLLNDEKLCQVLDNIKEYRTIFVPEQKGEGQDAKS